MFGICWKQESVGTCGNMREYVEICWKAGIRKDMLECLEIDRNLQAYRAMCWNELERVIICGAICRNIWECGNRWECFGNLNILQYVGICVGI